MVLPKYLFCMVLLTIVCQGCGSDNAEELANLQKQIATLTRQVEETRTAVETLQGNNQDVYRSLSALEAEVKRLKERPAPPPAPPAPTANRESAPSPPEPAPRQQKAEVSCREVWRLLGQGRDTRAVARTLNLPVETVQDCEQQIGRGGQR